MQVRTCQIYKNVILPKFIVFAGPDLSKFPKMFFDQNFSFLQVRTCQNFRKCTLNKIAHFCRTGPAKMYFDQNFSFCRTGPVKIFKKVLRPKFVIFAGLDLSKFSKTYFDQNFSFFYVRTC